MSHLLIECSLREEKLRENSIEKFTCIPVLLWPFADKKKIWEETKSQFYSLINFLQIEKEKIDQVKKLILI